MSQILRAEAKRARVAWLTALLILLASAVVARAQEGMTRVGDDDYLTGEEVSAIRDAQQPEKRLILYTDFAQRRVDAVKQALASGKSSAGRTVQKTLTEYIRVLEALDSSLQDARERRAPLEKALKDIDLRGNTFLKYLESINAESSPRWEDYQYTIEEAIDMTKDELAEVARGAFPEVQERTPPRELPGLPSSRSPASKGTQSEEGPPRKSDPPASQQPSEQEEGPPRKSQSRTPQ